MIDASPYAARGFQVLKVETHLHTLHSDGQHSVSAMFEACHAAGYDAVALTDHNTLSGLDEATVIADHLGLVLLPGVEVTTFRGHAIVLGVSRVPEWRDLEVRGMDALADDVHAQAGLVCVAHPAALGSPVCSGCAWDWSIRPESVDLWEIFSAPRPSTEVTVALWREQLAGGGLIAPVAAGDVHSTAAAKRPRAATFVYALERSMMGVLDALRARRAFASSGRRLDFWLQNDQGGVALAGTRVQSANWTPHVSPLADVRETELADGARCLYAELRDDQRGIEAISAPIWIASPH